LEKERFEKGKRKGKFLKFISQQHNNTQIFFCVSPSKNN
jgi:hypothetical protein